VAASSLVTRDECKLFIKLRKSSASVLDWLTQEKAQQHPSLTWSCSLILGRNKGRK
jgi:hypothetical protein